MHQMVLLLTKQVMEKELTVTYLEFKNLLIPYYEGKDEIKIKTFIKEKCYMSI